MITEPASGPITVTVSNGQRPGITVTSPAQVLNAVPYLLGFHPGKCLVIIGMKAAKGPAGVTLHYPLPAGAAGRETLTRYAEHALSVLNGNGLPAALVIGYGPDELVTPFITAFRSLAGTSHGTEVTGQLRACDGRYWSCTGSACCPPEGTPYEVTAGPELASLLPAGAGTVLRHRESLAQQVAPVTGAEATAMQRATRRARAQVTRLFEQPPASAWEPSGRALLARESARAVTAAIQRYRDGGTITRAQAAWLTVALTDLQVRDDAWSRLDPAHREASLRLLLDLTRLARRGHAAAPAALLAFVAWQSGNGALTNAAVDRALDDNPDYALARTIGSAVSTGARPELARMPLSPGQVAELYARQAEAKERA